MDANENDQFRLKKTADHLNMESDPSIAVSPVIPINSSPCSSVSMADYFVPMASIENSMPRATNSVKCTHIEKPIAMSSRGLFLPTVPTNPPSLPHFPADSAFVERAAIFSSTCGNFSGMIQSFGPSESMALCTNASKDVIGAQLQKITLNMSEAKDGSLPLDHESRSGSPVKDQINKESSHFGVTNNDPYETNSTEGSQETNINSADASGESSPGDLGAKKRKRIDQDKEMGDKVQRVPQSSLKNTKENTKAQQKLELNNLKPGCKHVKDSLEALEYKVHTRARRGRATNSHSIAERLRRERISERMKYLQDLVPGCNRVTGKAVMLDEIINYVQSLQQQVEFLSMKLAAVTPQHNYTIEGPFPNDLHPYDGTLSAAGLPQEIFHPQLYPSQWDPIPTAISSIVNPSNAYRRVMNSHSTTISGYEESVLQMHNSWTENLNNVKDDKWY